MDSRLVSQGILFVLITGVGWEDLPQEPGFGYWMTCWRRLRDRQGGGDQRAPRLHRPPTQNALERGIPYPDRCRMGRVPRPLRMPQGRAGRMRPGIRHELPSTSTAASDARCREPARPNATASSRSETTSATGSLRPNAKAGWVRPKACGSASPQLRTSWLSSTIVPAKRRPSSWTPRPSPKSSAGRSPPACCQLQPEVADRHEHGRNGGDSLPEVSNRRCCATVVTDHRASSNSPIPLPGHRRDTNRATPSPAVTCT